MSELSLPVVERTLHKTRIWLDDVMAVTETMDRAKAYRALRAVLHALRDELDVNEIAAFASQMPLLIRGLYYEGWQPHRETERPVGTATGFIARIGEEYGDFPTLELEHTARGIYRVISAHVSGGEMEGVTCCLPDAVRELLLADEYRAPCAPLLKAPS